MTDKITAICQECNKQFDYVLRPGFPRKYCFECSEKKKAEYEGQGSGTLMPPFPVEKVGEGRQSNIKRAYEQGKVNGNGAMFTSYAKDVFCNIQSSGTTANAEANMKMAIELVKQAKEAFE